MVEQIKSIVVVIVDALRADRVGALGSERNLTANLDTLADDGVVFENAFACTNATDPSVTSLHTGKDPETVIKHHGPFVTDDEKRRAESVPTVPELAQSSAIRTVAAGRPLGRWHQSGFDHYPEPAMDVHRRRQIGQYLEQLHPALRTIAGTVYESTVGRLKRVRETETDEVDDFLDHIDEGPFYGLVHMMDTHVPYEVDDSYVDELLDQYDYPNRDLAEFFEEHADSEYIDGFLRGHVDDRDFRDGLARLYAKYDAAVAHADEKIGRLVDGLRERGQFENTAVVVISDHGESLDEHGIYFDHHGLYDETIHVPMIIAGGDLPVDCCSAYVQLHDLAPTVLDLLGVDADIDGEGRSLQPFLGGRENWETREYIVAREALAQSRVAIRTPEYKFIKHCADDVLERERGNSLRCGYCNTLHAGERELYDLTSDHSETLNVAEDRPERVGALEEMLSSYHGSLSYPNIGDLGIEYEDEDAVMSRLEDLGYR